MKYLWILLNINKGSSISLKRGGHFVASIKWHRAVLDNSWSGWGSAKKLFLLWWMLWSTVWHRHPVNAKDSLGAFLMLFLTAALWNSLPIQQFFFTVRLESIFSLVCTMSLQVTPHCERYGLYFNPQISDWVVTFKIR